MYFLTKMTDTTAAPQGAPANGKTFTVDVVQRSDVGLVRSENQDFAITNTADEEVVHPEKGRLMVVADGMGGHRGGATASRMAATIVKTEYLASEGSDAAAALKAALEKANAAVFAEAQSNPELRGMGTTCSCLVLIGDKGYVAHVGDSRIYLVRGGQIRQITEDHSLVASMVREGLLTALEAESHPRRNVLQRSMGVGQDVEIDTFTVGIEPGDLFILCSDGLHGLVKADEMQVVAKLPLNEAASEFVKRSLDRGAPDNVTVIVARVGEKAEVKVAGAEGMSTVPLPKAAAIPALAVDPASRAPQASPAMTKATPIPAVTIAPAAPEPATPPSAAASVESFPISNKTREVPGFMVEPPAEIPLAARAPATAQRTRPRSSFAKWILLLIALGAVVIAFFWLWDTGSLDFGSNPPAGRSRR